MDTIFGYMLLVVKLPVDDQTARTKDKEGEALEDEGFQIP